VLREKLKIKRGNHLARGGSEDEGISKLEKFNLHQTIN
jgi:hypothetical protein